MRTRRAFPRGPGRSPLLPLLLSAVIGSELGAQDAFPTSLSTHGLPGLVVTPVAGSRPVGWLALGASDFPDFGAFWASPSFGRQYNGYLSFNLFSRVALGVRVSDRRPREPQPLIQVKGPGGTLTFELRHVDLSPNLQILVAPESRDLPGVSVGAYDLTGTGLLKARYVVASKTLGSVARVSAGYGFGPVLLAGPFGGVDLRPTAWSVLRGEWDGERVNAGIGLRPTLPGSLGRYVSVPEVQALWAEGKGWFWGASLRLPWDGDLARGAGPRPTERPVRDAARSWSTPSELLDGLVALGFENVAVAVSDPVVRVRYEDRLYLQNAMDGLKRVLDRVAREACGRARSAEITILSSERPVLRVTAAADELQAFRDGTDDGRGGTGLRFSYPSEGGPTEEDAWTASRSGSSRGKADLVLFPALATHLAWEGGLADIRVGMLPILEIPLHAGLNAALGASLPLWQSERMVVTGGPLPRPSGALALVSYIWNRSMSPTSSLALHWSGGLFNGQREGVRQQAALFLRSGRLRIDADVAATREYGGRGVDGLGIVGARWLFPGADTRMGVSAGRYLFGDWGGTAELSRYFGDTQVAVTVKHSQHGSQGVFTVSLPLTRERSHHPTRLRPRMPAAWSHRQTSTLFTGRGNPVAFDIAEGLETAFEAWDRFLDRDRLNPAAAGRAMAEPRFAGQW